MASGTTLSAYKPTLRDRIAWALSDAVGGDRGTTNYINSKVRDAVDFVPFVGDAVGADDAVNSFKAGNYGQAALEGGSAALGAIPGLGDALVTGGKALGLGLAGKGFYNAMKKGYKHDPNTLNIFAGMKARNADLGALDRAKRLAESGDLEPADIFRREGWFKAPDGNWKFEIPDHEAYAGLEVNRLDKEAAIEDLRKYGFSTAPTEPEMMDEVFYHPDLYNAYPQLRNIGVLDSRAPGNLGAFYQSDPRMANMVDGGLPKNYIEARTPRFSTGDPGFDAQIDPTSTMLHELQHAVQQIEGWDPGFNPEAALHTVARDDSFVNQTRNKMMEEMRGSGQLRALAGDSLFDAPMREDAISADAARRAAFEAYMRNMGEVEARNVQTRAKMPELSRYIPTQTMGRFPEEQLSSDDILYGKYGPEGVPGLSLRGPAIRRREW